MSTSLLELNNEEINELAELFDLLSKFDFNDHKNEINVSEDVRTGSSKTGGEPFLEPCGTIEDNPSFKGREVQRSSY